MLLKDRWWGSLLLVSLGFQTHFARLQAKKVMLFLSACPANTTWDLRAKPDPFSTVITACIISNLVS